MFFLKIEFFFFFILSHFAFGCPIEHPPEFLTPLTAHPRFLQNNATLEPLRIVFDYSAVSSYDTTKLNYLKNILGEVGNFLSSILKVNFIK